jgi:O-antigen/teichoic acid export membrane protein
VKSLVLRALGWNTSVKVTGQVFKWAITILVVRLLSPSDYGLMAMAMILVGFMNLFNEIGLADVIVQKPSLENRLLRQVFGLVLALNTFLWMVAFVSAPGITWFYGEPRLTMLIRILSFDFIIMALGTVQEAVLVRRLDFKSKSLIETGAEIAGGVVTLFLAYSGMGVWSLVVGHLTVSSLSTLGYNVVVRMPLRPILSLRGMKDELSFGGFVTADRVLWYFYSQADVFIIGKLLGKELLGFYSIATHFAHLPMSKIIPLLNVVGFSAFSKIQHTPKDVGYYHVKTVRLIGLFSFPLFLGLSSVAPEFIQVFLGEKWMVSSLPLQLICLVMPLQMLSSILFPAVLGMGRADVGLRNSVVFALIMPGAFAIGCNWGIVGVSVAWLAGFPIAWAIVLARTLPLMHVSIGEYLAALSRPLVAAWLMWGAVHGIAAVAGVESIITLLVVKVATGVATYVALLFLLHREGIEEVVNLLRSFRGGGEVEESLA